MACFVASILLALLFLTGLDGIEHPPKIQVYSHHPTENGKPNFLNCYVSGFHPHQTEIEFLKNRENNVEESDLAFSKHWFFYVLIHAEFTPSANDEYSPRVVHITLKEPMTVK